MFGLSGGNIGTISVCFLALIIFLRICVSDEMDAKDRRKSMIISGIFLIWLVASQAGSIMGNKLGKKISDAVNVTLYVGIACFLLYYIGSAFVYVRKKQYDKELLEKAKEYQKQEDDLWGDLEELEELQKPRKSPNSPKSQDGLH